MSGLKEQICEEVAKIEVQCAAVAIPITVTVWHLMVFAALAVIAGILLHLILRYANIAIIHWKQSLGVKSHAKGAVNYPSTLMINAHRMSDMFARSELKQRSLKEASQILNREFENEYFLVEFRENGAQLFRKELRLRAGWKMLNFFEFRTDPETLKTLKAKSASDDDDDTESNIGAIGEFDIFARPIKPWDFRHWLHHPNREIRIGLWVAMFAAFLEFGPDLISSIRALLQTP